MGPGGLAAPGGSRCWSSGSTWAGPGGLWPRGQGQVVEKAGRGVGCAESVEARIRRLSWRPRVDL